MSGSPVQPILDSAARAASSGDYASAESLLREVALLQAASLGPQHPDLASTFNNLGVVCEKAHKLVDAGEFYREAFSIASACLDAEDPLVVTSRDNLDEFRRSHGTAAETASPNIEAAAPVREHDTPNILSATPTSSAVGRQFGIVAGIALGVVLLSAVAIWFTRAPEEPRTAEQRALELGQPLVPVSPVVSSQESIPATLPEVSTVAEQPPSQRPSTHTIVERRAPSTEDAPAKTAVPTPTNGAVQVLEASLCQQLSMTGARWACTPPSEAAAGGSLYFYTRIASPTSVHVRHRWYRDGSLRQDVTLGIQANPSAGYRTYSRQRVETGEWRIEVMAEDGAILGEEHIAIP
jgi:Protein of unknown function (DUF2914)/Tetratricopeptide repeat